MKGISTIIATIIMVVITIGLISVAYLYMSGLIAGTTAQNIALLDAYCDANTNNVTLLLKNDGTADIAFTDIDFTVNGTITGIGSNCAGTLSAGGTRTCTIDGIAEGFQELRVIGPSNAVGGTVECR